MRRDATDDLGAAAFAGRLAGRTVWLVQERVEDLATEDGLPGPDAPRKVNFNF